MFVPGIILGMKATQPLLTIRILYQHTKETGLVRSSHCLFLKYYETQMLRGFLNDLVN